MTYKDIKGYCDYEWFYKRIFDQMPDEFVMVEVGVWLGHSVAYMSHLCQEERKTGFIYAVDTFEGSSGESSHSKFVAEHGGSIYHLFGENMLLTGSDNVMPVKAESRFAVNRFSDESLYFVFIDASHDYESVKQDIELWWPKVRPGGILSGHDYGSWNGVTQAVHEFGNGFKTEKNVWWIQK